MGLDIYITRHAFRAGSYSWFSDFRSRLFKYRKIKGMEVLLDHSDCDGNISTEDCKLLRVALLNVYKKERDGDLGPTLMLWIDALTVAIREGGILEFA